MLSDSRVRWKLHVLAALMTCFVFILKHMYDDRAREIEDREVTRCEKERNYCEDRHHYTLVLKGIHEFGSHRVDFGYGSLTCGQPLRRKRHHEANREE